LFAFTNCLLATLTAFSAAFLSFFKAVDAISSNLSKSFVFSLTLFFAAVSSVSLFSIFFSALAAFTEAFSISRAKF